MLSKIAVEFPGRTELWTRKQRELLLWQLKESHPYCDGTVTARTETAAGKPQTRDEPS